MKEKEDKVEKYTLPRLYESSLAFNMAVYSAGEERIRASRRSGTFFKEAASGSINATSLVTCNENIDEAKPEPYENMPIRLPRRDSTLLL